MSNEDLTFNELSKERIFNNCKCCTSRRKSHGENGSTFELADRTYKIERIYTFPLWFVRDYLFIQEGCITPKEFQEEWTQIYYNEPFIPDKVVFVHFFKRIK